MKTRRERERLRRMFQPRQVRLLFIGESPPASGRFFYAADSGLYRAMRMAFETADPAVKDRDFLSVFQQRGCYLIDLCDEPVDHLDPAQRRALHRAGERGLARELKRLQPTMIAPVLRAIARNVRSATAMADWHGAVLQLPYPGRWSRHRDAFIDALVPVIRDLRL